MFKIECVVILTVAAGVLAGCGAKDGLKELEAGKVAYGVRDLKKAERFFEKSVQYAPDRTDAWVYLARVRLDLGELPEARKCLDKAIEQAGDDSDVRLLDAQIAWHEKDFARAAELFSGIAKDKELSAEVRSQGWAGLGIVELTNNRWHHSRIALLRAMQVDRRNAAACYHLGLLYRDGFAYPEAALDQFDVYVHLNEIADPRVQKVQRTVMPELKEMIARMASDRAPRRDSAASAAALTRAESLVKKGAMKDLKNARLAYEEALKADPLSYPAALGLAKLWPRIDGKEGQRKSLECYKLACSLKPSAVSTFVTVGGLAIRLGFAAQAVEIYSRAIAADPTNISALDGIVRSMRMTGSADNKAIAALYADYRASLPVRKAKKK